MRPITQLLLSMRGLYERLVLVVVSAKICYWKCRQALHSTEYGSNISHYILYVAASRVYILSPAPYIVHQSVNMLLSHALGAVLTVVRRAHCHRVYVWSKKSN